MKLIRPMSVTDATLTSSDVPETDYPVWSAATAYIIGDRVIRTTGVHKIFERKIAGTTATPPENDTTNWLDLGATNRWKMFDYVVGTQTTNPDEITINITPGEIVSGLALLNISAKAVQVKCTTPADGTIYDQTINLIDTVSITDWWYYFFEPITYRQDIIVLDLPTDLSMSVEVTITSTGSTVSAGVFVIGTVQSIGTTTNGTSVGIKDYSRKETDTFGNYIIVPRTFSKRASFAVKVQRNRVDRTQRLLAELRTTPVVYVGSESFDSTIIYGFYRDFDIVIDSAIADCNIEIEGLT